MSATELRIFIGNSVVLFTGSNIVVSMVIKQSINLTITRSKVRFLRADVTYLTVKWPTLMNKVWYKETNEQMQGRNTGTCQDTNLELSQRRAKR